ncbi:MAG: hypothetical protein ABL993_10600 [Vicinamibacterales bacterium]
MGSESSRTTAGGSRRCSVRQTQVAQDTHGDGRRRWTTVMGHANVDTTLNVYTQVLDGALRDAVERVGGTLFTLVHKPEEDGTGSAA